MACQAPHGTREVRSPFRVHWCCSVSCEAYSYSISGVCVCLQLEVGTMMVVENSRVMHGRDSFSGQRNLVGCYMSREEVDSTARVLGLL